MTDIEICQRDALYCFRRQCLGVTPGSLAEPVIWGLSKDSAMTIEILHLTAQIQRWLNARVARHLAAQAERLAR
jgi:hypothetical protein